MGGIKHKYRYVWLDFIRGASALAVCAGHLRAATFAKYAEVPESGHIVQKVFYAITGLGHQAVMVFFVLSGFFVGGSIIKSGPHFHLGSYASARLTRLWVALIPALLITAGIDKVISFHSPEVLLGAYFDIWSSGPQPRSYSASALTFFGNVLFLQGIFVPVFGTDGPLWSLANEFWYYALFPAIGISLGFIGNRANIRLRIGCGSFACLSFLAIGASIVPGFLVWLQGVFAYVVCRHMHVRKRYSLLIWSLGLFSVLIAYSKADDILAPSLFNRDIFVGLGFAPICALMASWPALCVSKLKNIIESIFRSMAEFSYSLYVVHFPFVILISSIVFKFKAMVPNTTNLVRFCVWFSILICIGGIFWFSFERKTESIRRKLSCSSID